MHALNLVRPDLGYKPYRIRCRVRTLAGRGPDLQGKALLAQVESWIDDMKLQGWDYDDRGGLELTGGPYTVVETVVLQRPKPRMSNKEMLWRVSQGDPCRDTDQGFASLVPDITEVEFWEYEVAATFVHKTILVESPSADEERKVLALR